MSSITREIGDNVHQAYTSANELVAAKADVIVVAGAELGLQAAAAARPSVPIVVMANNYDPIERGYIKSLSHPGGNITGLFYEQGLGAWRGGSGLQKGLMGEWVPRRKTVQRWLQRSFFGRSVQCSPARCAVAGAHVAGEGVSKIRHMISRRLSARWRRTTAG